MIAFSGQCSIDSIVHSIKAHPSVVRKHVAFWVSQGLLKEVLHDVYILIQDWNADSKAASKRELCFARLGRF